MKPDSAILTHTDAGHLAAPGLVMEMFPLRQVASGMTGSQGSVAQKWARLGAETIRISEPRRGDLLDFGAGAWGEILLSPADGLLGSVADDKSLVFRLHWRDRKILFTGDAGRLSEQALLESGIDLRADVIVAGLHESELSLTEAFVAAVNPQVIVIPRPAGCEMDLYRTSLEKWWRKEGVEVIDQMETGGLTVTVGEEGELLFQGVNSLLHALAEANSVGKVVDFRDEEDRECVETDIEGRATLRQHDSRDRTHQWV